MYKHQFPAEIETPRLYLRRNRLEWAPAIFAAIEADRQNLRPFLPWVDFTATVEDEYAYLHQTHTQWESCEVFDYSIFLRGSDQFVGSIGLHNILWLGGSAELGYWLLSPWSGQGLATEATRAVVELAFAREFHRLEIRCTEDNVRSARVALRLGFTREARLRESSANLGQIRDVLVYAVLRTEWNVGGPRGPAWLVLIEELENSAPTAWALTSLGLESAGNVLGRTCCARRFANEDELTSWKQRLADLQHGDRNFAAAWSRARVTFARVDRPTELPANS